jgi:sugar phosphate isomerase/epimerase
MQAGLDRLRRAADYASHKSVLLLLENLNKEPPDAEVHYLAYTIDEWRWFYEKLDSAALQLSFTANHAHLVPEGVQGFIEAMPLPRVREIRLAACFRNGREEHLIPGQGDFDFMSLFEALERKGFAGHYMNTFGSLDDMLKARGLFAGMKTG